MQNCPRVRLEQELWICLPIASPQGQLWWGREGGQGEPSERNSHRPALVTCGGLLLSLGGTALG